MRRVIIKVHKLLSYISVVLFHYGLPKLKNQTSKSIKEQLLSMQNQINTLSSEINNLKREKTALRVLIDNCIDISLIPKANGTLRELQLADTYFLKVFDKICTKHQIQYWLEYGTLLGSIRHKGFIPWDDDLDIGVLREDYLKIKEIFNNELFLKYFEISQGKGFCRKILRIHVKNSPLQIDLWPYDSYYKKSLTPDEKRDLYKELYNCHQKFWHDFPEREVFSGNAVMPYDMIQEYTDKYILKNNKKKNDAILFNGIEYWIGERCIYEYNDVFPLKKISFEDCELLCANKPNNLLKRTYGNNYMKLPDTDYILYYHSNIKLNSQEIEYGVRALKEFEKSFDTAHK